MGRLITLSGGDEPVNEGERRVVSALTERLPDSYIIIPNTELAETGGQTYEYDAIVIAPHAVYAVEIKDWYGDIIGDMHEWLHNGRTKRSPVAQINRKARVLKSYLANAEQSLTRIWVEGAVCLASKPRALNLDADARRQAFLLDELIDFIIDPAAIRARPQEIVNLRDTIARTLGARLRKRSGPLVFGQYETIETLEHNGDETLYRARRRDMPAAPEVRLRVVALSPYRLSAQQLTERRAALMRETEALLRMGAHPNIVGAREAFDDQNGHIVLVLDGTEGRSLRQRLQDGTPLTVEDRLDILIAICQALVHAHAHGVIHRHVEPSAILLGEDTIPRLTDFSLAKLLTPNAATVWYEETTAAIDHRFVAPEVEQPGYGEPSTASDLYSLGCVAFLLFASQPPFEAPGEAVRRTPELPNDAPARLCDLCRTLLIGSPSLRLSDARGALAALQEARGADGRSSGNAPKSEYAIGETIDSRFEVRAILGGGGFSTVYRVFRAMDDREYALKIFNANTDIEKVKREISILNKIHNSHVVEAVWADQTRAGQWYLVTRLVPGETLTDYARGRKRLAPQEAVAYICQLLEALEAFHPNHQRIGELRRIQRESEMTEEEYNELRQLEAEGIVHRDIKPQNLILGEQGLVLIDFNISSYAGQQVNTMSGTPPYQAPDIQQALDRWDPTSDLFAVGVTLYELLCYQHPYENANPLTGAGPHDPRDYRPELTAALAEFLLKACAPYRDERFTTATEMREALQAIAPLTNTASRPAAETGKLSERLKQLIAAAPPNVNPMVSEFLSLSSQARRSNRGTRGMDEIAAATYIKTQLDTRLTESVMEGRHRLVIVTGNAGDGKTAFIQQVEEAARRSGAVREQYSSNGSTLRYQGRHIITLYDGSQDEAERSSDEVLRAFFQPFTSGGQPDNATRLAAINEGRLRDFLLAHRADYPRFAPSVISVLDAPTQAQDIEQEFGAVVVNLNARSLTTGGADSIFSQQIQAIVSGPFWEPCQTCAHAARCPIKHNVETFRDTTSGAATTERLRILVDLLRLRRQRHLTMRDIRSLISHILFRDHDCADIGETLRSDDPFSILDLAYFQGPGGVGVSGDSILERGARMLSEIDVALVANPEEDRRIAQGHAPRAMSFPDRPSDYPRDLVARVCDQAGIGYHANVRQAQRAHRAARRQVFFERADDGWWTMLPYQRLSQFTAALDSADGQKERDKLLLEIIAALSLYEGFTDKTRIEQALWLATNDQVSSEYRTYRRFLREEFVLRIAPVVAPYIETASDRLQLLHTPSGIELDIDVDLLEVLDRLRHGYAPTAEAGRGFLINVRLFKHQLLARPTDEVLLEREKGQIMRIAFGPTQGSVALTKE